MGEPQWGSSDNSLDSQSPRYKKDRDIWNSQVQHTLKISSAQRARLLTMRKEKIIKSAFPVVTSLICSHFKAPEVSRPRSKSCQRRKRDRPILSVPNIQFQHFVMYLFRLVDVRRSHGFRMFDLEATELLEISVKEALDQIIFLSQSVLYASIE